MLSSCSGKHKQHEQQHEHGETHFSLGTSVGRKGAGPETRLDRTFWQINLKMEENTYCLDSDLLLGPGQQNEIMVVLDKKWGEDTLVSRHHHFDEPEVEVVGEVGEDGEHMYVGLKNLSDSPVTLKKNTVVAQLRPRGHVENLSQLHGKEGEASGQANLGRKTEGEGGSVGEKPSGTPGACATGDSKHLRYISFCIFRRPGQLGRGLAHCRKEEEPSSDQLPATLRGEPVSFPPAAWSRPLRRVQQ